MRARTLTAVTCLGILAGCGIEGLFGNAFRTTHVQPASELRGAATYPGAATSTITALDGDGNDLLATLPPTVFYATVAGGSYDLQLLTSHYSMLRVQANSGDMALRALVPQVGPESVVRGVDLDARSVTETLIVEARVSHDQAAKSPTAPAAQASLKLLSPAAYVGDGVNTGTRTLIRKALDQAGPAQDLLKMVEALLPSGDPLSGSSSPAMFSVPVVDKDWTVTTSPVDAGWLSRKEVDYNGDGVPDHDSSKFDTALVAAAKLFDPAGCLDPTHIRLVFTVDYNAGALDGLCAVPNRFKWAPDKPGKSMYFVGWIYALDPPGKSEVQDPEIANLLGNSTPNVIPMYDDGTNGDEVAHDGIYTVAFSMPYDPAKKLRIGYKYTWGFFGQGWTGSEEWPGNSRMFEVVDVNGDGLVYRRDVFADEATNKDKANSNPASGGALTWDKAFHGCGPEAQEQKFTVHSACTCGTEWFVPKAIGPVRIACTE